MEQLAINKPVLNLLKSRCGLDLWLKNKLQASFEVDNIPYEADKDGNFYMVGNREVSKVIKCHIDILSPKGKPPVWQR